MSLSSEKNPKSAIKSALIVFTHFTIQGQRKNVDSASNVLGSLTRQERTAFEASAEKLLHEYDKQLITAAVRDGILAGVRKALAEAAWQKWLLLACQLLAPAAAGYLLSYYQSLPMEAVWALGLYIGAVLIGLAAAVLRTGIQNPD